MIFIILLLFVITIFIIILCKENDIQKLVTSYI